MRQAPHRVLETYRTLLLVLWFLAAACGTLCAQQKYPARSINLSQAIDLALKQNRNIQLARLSITDALHKKEEQRAAYFPHIKNESALLHITRLAGVTIPAGAFGSHSATGLIPGKDLFLGQGSPTTYTSGTGMEQPVTQLLKILAANRAAEADVSTARIQADAAEDNTALKVRQMYYTILVTQLKQQAAKQAVEATKVKQQESTAAVTQGRALAILALQSQAASLNARQNLLIQDLSLHNQIRQLDELLGLPLSTDLSLDPIEPHEASEILTREEYRIRAQENNPDILAARQSVEKARAWLAAAKDAYIPDLTGLARYSYQSGVPLLVHNFGTFGFSFTYNLFDGGKRSAELKDARTLLSEAELNRTNVEEEIVLEIEQAYDKVEDLQQMVSVADEAQKISVEAVRLADRQVEQDAALLSARSEADAQAFTAAASALDAQLGLTLAQADLERLTGKVAH